MLKMSLGYTLFELVVTLTLLAIISFMAIPGGIKWLQTTQVEVQLHQLIGAINLARNEALRRNTTVSICPSRDGLRCSGTWDDGYLVFLNQGQHAQVSTAANRVRFFQRHAAGNHLYWHGRGILHLHSNSMIAANAGQFSLCSANHQAEFDRAVIISLTGRVRISKPTLADCGRG